MHDFRSGECWRQTDAGEGLLEMIARGAARLRERPAGSDAGRAW